MTPNPSTTERFKLLMIRMSVAFEEAFPKAPSEDVLEFCEAFIEERFGVQTPEQKFVSKMRCRAALVKVRLSEPDVSVDELQRRMYPPVEAVLQVILREQEQRIQQLNNEFVSARWDLVLTITAEQVKLETVHQGVTMCEETEKRIELLARQQELQANIQRMRDQLRTRENNCRTQLTGVERVF